MLTAPIPKNESQRIQVVNSLKFLRGRADEQINELVEFCSKYFQVPIVLISIIREDTQEFFANKGLNANETGRDISFCGHAIEGTGIFEIKDASGDYRFSDNPLVTGYPYIAFYAGQPLIIKGQPVGTLCLIDQKPKKLSVIEEDFLRYMAVHVEDLITQKEQALSYLNLINEYHDQMLQMEESNAQMKKILSAISHDAINPVQSIKGLLDMGLQDDITDPKELFGFMLESLNSSENMLKELITWGSDQLNQKENSLVELEYILQTLALEQVSSLKRKNNSLEFDFQDEYYFEPMKLKFILRNLIKNANKFSQASTILLKIKEDDDSIVFEVIDEGKGMTKEQLNSINAHSSSVSQSGTAGESGFGIGIQLCHRFASELDGELFFRSEEGKGTTATLKIALCDKHLGQNNA